MLLALDLATTTGFAVGDPAVYRPLTPLEVASQGGNAKPYSGAQRIGAKNAEIGPFGVEYEDWLGDMIAVHMVDRIVFEAPWIGGQTSQDTARKLMGLACWTESVACRKGVPWVFEANNASVRKHFTGVGRGDRSRLKRLTIEACQLRGWDPRGEDEADALALYDYACHCIQNGVG